MSGSQPIGLDAPHENRVGRLSVADLRRAVPGRMWGGKGCGAPCDFCRVHLGAEEIEYEVEARLEGETLLLHFHPRCYDAWRTSRNPRNAAEDPSAPPR